MKHWRVLVVMGALVIGGWSLNHDNLVRSQQAALLQPRSVRKLPATVINELQRMIQPLRSLVEAPKTTSNVTISREPPRLIRWLPGSDYHQSMSIILNKQHLSRSSGSFIRRFRPITRQD